MPRWLRPVLAAGITAGIVIGGEVAQRAAKDDLKKLAAKYPAVAASETVQGFLSGIPFLNLVFPASGLAGAVLDPAVEATLSEADRSRYSMNRAILKWVPFVEIAALVVGVPLTLYFVWADLLEGPRRARLAAATAAPVAAAIPLPQAQVAAPVLAAAGQAPPGVPA